MKKQNAISLGMFLCVLWSHIKLAAMTGNRPEFWVFGEQSWITI